MYRGKRARVAGRDRFVISVSIPEGEGERGKGREGEEGEGREGLFRILAQVDGRDRFVILVSIRVNIFEVRRNHVLNNMERQRMGIKRHRMREPGSDGNLNVMFFKNFQIMVYTNIFIQDCT